MSNIESVFRPSVGRDFKDVLILIGKGSLGERCQEVARDIMKEFFAAEVKKTGNHTSADVTSKNTVAGDEEYEIKLTKQLMEVYDKVFFPCSCLYLS